MQILIRTLIWLLIFAAFAVGAQVTTAFTYQGKLELSGSAATGDFDFEFQLFDEATGGSVLAAPISVSGVSVEGGLLSTEIDFGSQVFGLNDVWLQVAVRQSGSSDPFVPLSPRQKITPVPVAQHALAVEPDAIGSAQVIDGSVGAAEVDDSQIQLRIVGACPEGAYIRTVNSNGSVICEPNPAASSNVGPSVYLNSTQPIPESTQQVIPFNAERFDPNSSFDTGTHQFTAPETGFYHVSANVTASRVSGGGDPVSFCLRLYVLPSSIIANSCGRGDNDFFGTFATISRLVELAAGDQLELRGIVFNQVADGIGYQISGDATGINSFMTIHRVR